MGRDRAGQLVVGTFLYIPFFSIVLPDLNPYDNSLAVYNLWWWPGGHRLNSTLPLLLFLLCKIEWKEENTIANVELFQLLVCQRVLGNLTILCGNLTHQSFRILPPSCKQKYIFYPFSLANVTEILEIFLLTWWMTSPQSSICLLPHHVCSLITSNRLQ